MLKKLVVVRNERATYEVHIGKPPEKAVGGVSLDRKTLTDELRQHGCPEELIPKLWEDTESNGSATDFV
jgi:hypothetical protein